ncbi:MAG: hypothetical protein ACRDIB_11545 [Ardenticatenaceae bacterium]
MEELVAAPFLITSYPTPKPAEGVATDEESIFVAAGEAGVYVLQLI